MRAFLIVYTSLRRAFKRCSSFRAVWGSGVGVQRP